MRRLVIVPDGWPCRLGECRPGFFLFNDRLCMMSEYGGEAYNEGGEMFWGGAKSKEERANLILQPVDPTWEEYEP